MRLLVVIPHYFCRDNGGAPGRYGSTDSSAIRSRTAVLRRTIATLHQTFGPRQGMLQIAERKTISVNHALHESVEVVVVTDSTNHLVDELDLPVGFFEHVTTVDPSLELGFRCHQVLRDRHAHHDYCGYLEDDLWLDDPWYFEKLHWFESCTDSQNLLLPNRFELGTTTMLRKCYVDGDLRPEVTEHFQNRDQTPELNGRFLGQAIRFHRPLNPHAGCFFLSTTQAKRWFHMPHFGSRDSSFVGPLESAATLSVGKTFRIYKPAPANAAFAEVQHGDARFIQLIQ